MANMLGIDVSHWQKTINLKTIQANFVIIKATQGTSYRDECFGKFANDILSSGKLFGMYHFADGKSTGKKEAKWFLENVKTYIGKGLLVLDWEANALAKGPSYAKEFCDTIYSATGVLPILYCSKSVLTSYDWKEFIKTYKYVWVAEYGANQTKQGYVGYPTSGRSINGFTEIIRQYSSKTVLPGYTGNLDANVAYFDSNKWNQLSKKVVAPTPTPAKPDKKLSVTEVANKIINKEDGWGVNGSARVKKLKEAGYIPEQVQAEINKIIDSKKDPASYYTVQKGDTFTKIAKNNNMTIDQLKKLNPDIVDINKIEVGQKIRIK